VSIDLPEEIRGYADRFDIRGAEGQVAGECVVTTTKLECTVDDAYVASHPLNMSGSFSFYEDASVNNTVEETRTCDFGNAETSVTVTPKSPGGGPCETDCDFGGYENGWKNGWVSDFEKDEITWQVVVKAPAVGIPAGQDITVTDHLDTDVL